MRSTLLVLALAACGCTAPIAPSRVDALVTPASLFGFAPSVGRVAPRDIAAVPAWQKAILSKIIADVTDTARRDTKAIPGLVVFFEIEAVDQIDGTHIVGELRDPRQSRSGLTRQIHYLLVPNALDFPNKATFLHALETAVTYQAEVRLVNGPIACCLEKPAITVTGRFEGQF